MKKYMIIGLIAALALTACKTKELIPSKYVSWMKDPSNGLREEKTIGDYTFTLQYKTPEFVVLQQYKTDDIARAKVEQEAADYSGLEYYTFEITTADGHDLLDGSWHSAEEVAARLEYFLSYAQDDFSMVTASDTLPCVLFHFERSYSLSPVTTLVMAFDKPTANEDRTVVFNDRLLSTGPVHITIEAEDISTIPTVKYAYHE